MSSQNIRIVVIDDHPVVLEGLKGLLANFTSFSIVATFNHPHPFLEFIKNNFCDVILMDINLPEIKGPDLCKKVHSIHKDIKVIAISSHQEASIVKQMSQAGAKGYVLKNVDPQELNHAILSVYSGKMFFSSDIQQILFDKNLRQESEIHLTRREKEVLILISKGMTTQQIADHFIVSPLTIESHRRNLMQKFEVNNSPSLIRLAYEKKFID